MSGRHVALVVEDDLPVAEALGEVARSLGHEAILVATLSEACTELERGGFCYVLLDMQIPPELGTKPFVGCGKTFLGLMKKRNAERHRIPVLIVTSYSTEPDFVWEMRGLDADEFIAKPFKHKIEAVYEKIRKCLCNMGREEHDACQRFAAETPTLQREVRSLQSAPSKPVGVLHAHDRKGVSVDVRELEELMGERQEYDLFLNFVAPGPKGYVAGRRDWQKVYEDITLSAAMAAIVAELVTEGKAVHAKAMKAVRQCGITSPVRVIERARSMLDVTTVNNGKKSRRQWRAFRTINTVGGNDNTKQFAFNPPPDYLFAVIVPVR